MLTLLNAMPMPAPPATTGWDFDQFQPYATKIAAFLIAAWVVYIIWQYAIPSKRQAKVKWGRVAVMGFASILLLDLNLIQTIITSVLNAAWAVGGIFVPTWFQAA